MRDLHSLFLGAVLGGEGLQGVADLASLGVVDELRHLCGAELRPHRTDRGAAGVGGSLLRLQRWV
jgi:hypothetical protein